MTLPKEIIIKELMYHFNYSEDKATCLFNSYEGKGKVDDLSQCLETKQNLTFTTEYS